MTTAFAAEIMTPLAAAATASYDAAWSMPKGFYTDPAVFAAEREHLFGRDWVCIGRTEEISKPGDAMAFKLCDEPLVAVHGEDGAIRVLSNVCRHRGALLVSGQCSGARLVCPYHHWSFHLDGRLAAAPRMETHKAFDAASCRLPEIRSEVWTGFLFVTLDPEARPLAAQLTGLTRMVEHYHLEQQAARYVATEVWDCNWKCFIENFMEGYHLSPLHRTTLHPVNPTRLCTHYRAGDIDFGYNAGFSPDLPRSEKGHPDLTDAEVDNCVMFAVAPGLVSGCAGDYSSFICVQPESVDRVRLKMGLIFYGDHWTGALVDKAVTLFHETMEEDRVVLVGLMEGLASRLHQPGPLAPADFEGPVLDLYRYVGRRLDVGSNG